MEFPVHDCCPGSAIRIWEDETLEKKVLEISVIKLLELMLAAKSVKDCLADMDNIGN